MGAKITKSKSVDITSAPDQSQNQKPVENGGSEVKASENSHENESTENGEVKKAEEGASGDDTAKTEAVNDDKVINEKGDSAESKQEENESSITEVKEGEQPSEAKTENEDGKKDKKKDKKTKEKKEKKKEENKEKKKRSFSFLGRKEKKKEETKEVTSNGEVDHKEKDQQTTEPAAESKPEDVPEAESVSAVEEPSSDKLTTSTNGLIPTKISWEHGAKEVQITGSFSEWKDNVQLNASDDAFSVTVDLKEGEHHIKFFVDGNWTVNKNLNVVDLEGQGQVNLLVVGALPNEE